MTDDALPSADHSHIFLAADHERSEKRAWAVIWLCGAMMVTEVAGGLVFGSIALVADGLHMSTHAGALLLAALAYSYSRRHAHDARFTFGTGKLGDLAGFASAMVLAMIALYIGCESVARLVHPVTIHFAEAIPIACLGLIVNVASVWLLSSGGHHHHDHHHAHDHADESQPLCIDGRSWTLAIDEIDSVAQFTLVPPADDVTLPDEGAVRIARPDGSQQEFKLRASIGRLESLEQIPEPHEFTAVVEVHGQQSAAVSFSEHDHGAEGAHRDNNMRAAITHVFADAAVSVLVIIGLILAKLFGWLWMDPVAGIVGALVIGFWSYGLVRDTGSILLDVNPDSRLATRLRSTIEADGDRLMDLHLWRVGPGHLAAILCVATGSSRQAQYYRGLISRYKALSHVTVEVRPA